MNESETRRCQHVIDWAYNHYDFDQPHPKTSQTLMDTHVMMLNIETKLNLRVE